MMSLFLWRADSPLCLPWILCGVLSLSACEPDPLPLITEQGSLVSGGASIMAGAQEAGAQEAGAQEAGAQEAGAEEIEVRGDELRGLWRARQVTTSVMTLPVVMEEVTTTSTSELSLHVRQEGERLWVSVEICSVSLESAPDIGQRLLPEAFLASLSLMEREGRVWWAEGALQLELPPAYEVRGALLSDPLQDPLPTEASDPRVIDADRDGHPGLTVTLTGFPAGDVYLVQRSWDAWRGAVTMRGVEGQVERLEGEVAWGEEQSRLGATNDVLLIDVPQWALEGKDSEGRALQRFELWRSSAEDAPCER